MKKLTIADILERKKVIKPLEKTFYSEVLGGEIEIKKINPDKISELVQHQANLGQFKAYLKIIYESCPIFQNKELHEQFKPVEPFEVVDMIFETNLKEIYELGNKILEIYGFLPRGDIETVKKQ